MNVCLSKASSLVGVSGVGYLIYKYLTQDYIVAIKNILDKDYTLIYSVKQLIDFIKLKKTSRYSKLSFHFNPDITDDQMKEYSKILSIYIYKVNHNLLYFAPTLQN